MDLDRRTAMAAGLGAVVTAAAGVPTAQAAQTARAAPPTITVPGESPARTNIPVARDRRASGGRHLALLTAERPPSDSGWYATNRVRASHTRVYALTAVATAPVETPHNEANGSYLQLAVDEGPFIDLARSQPHWYESPPTWGDLSVLDLGTVELAGGEHTLTFRVVEPTVLDDATAYVLSLDHFTLRPPPGRHPTLREASVPRHRADSATEPAKRIR
ncbi:hypothetical protein [Streptomyces sp. ALI-76-A]|uniref:hypothetical protein n=1 Tax=Streptomyces sp. ALI-76-A TaxID=3025736 RepID=UPI00256EC845|nr:hypothetical protein [Streptomyces sp. ALI-76-A]MDL5205973.1 hypothetical protein [Streptomyces sp. ALI-76-A]